MPDQKASILNCRDAAALASTAAAQWVTALVNRPSDAPYLVALSGGRLTRAFFGDIVSQVKARKVSHAGVHFFWADERCLPPTDSESNFKLANDRLFQPLNLPASQIHRWKGELEPLAAAREAEAELRQIATRTHNSQPVFDLVFLGMGEDGHVASLFPSEQESMTQDPAAVRAVFNSPKPPPNRLTLGYRTIAAAEEVWVMISGEAKRTALKASLESGGKTPLGRLLALRPQTHIFTDVDLGPGLAQLLNRHDPQPS